MQQRLFLLCLFFALSSPLWAQQSSAGKRKKNPLAPYLAEGFTFPVGKPSDSLTVTFSKGDDQSQVMSPGPNTIWLAQKHQSSLYSDLIITFSKPVTSVDFTISHLNNNTDGVEIIDNFQIFDSGNNSLKESMSIHWSGNPNITNFNPSKQVLQATDGHCCEEANGRLTFSSTQPFTTIIFRQRTLVGVPNGIIISETVDLSVKTPERLKQTITPITNSNLKNALMASQEKENRRRDSTMQQVKVSAIKDSIKPAEKKTALKKTESNEKAKTAVKKTTPAPEKKPAVKTQTTTLKKTPAKQPVVAKVPDKKPVVQTQTTTKKTEQKKPTVKKAPVKKPATPAKKQPSEKAHDIAQLESLKVGDKIKLNHVFFKQSLPELLSDSYFQLDTLVTLMKKYPTLEIELQGHTDNQGDAEKNRILSEQRVAMVKQYLVDKGIAAERLKTKGLGMMEPDAPNDTEENRKLNRRVEFVITNR